MSAVILDFHRGRRMLRGLAAECAAQARMRQRGLLPSYPVVIKRPEPEPA